MHTLLIILGVIQVGKPGYLPVEDPWLKSLPSQVFNTPPAYYMYEQLVDYALDGIPAVGANSILRGSLPHAQGLTLFDGLRKKYKSERSWRRLREALGAYYGSHSKLASKKLLESLTEEWSATMTPEAALPISYADLMLVYITGSEGKDNEAKGRKVIERYEKYFPERGLMAFWHIYTWQKENGLDRRAKCTAQEATMRFKACSQWETYRRIRTN